MYSTESYKFDNYEQLCEVTEAATRIANLYAGNSVATICGVADALKHTRALGDNIVELGYDSDDDDYNQVKCLKEMCDVVSSICRSDTLSACETVKQKLIQSSRELIIDYLDNPKASEESEASEKLKELCGISTEYIVCQVTYATRRSIKPRLEMTDNFYEWLDNEIQCEDCKNGCQIYKDKDGYYFCISGSGTDEVHIRIKEYVWNK